MTETVDRMVRIPAGMPQYDDVPRFDVARVRADFPILDRTINGHPLVYLDSANTSQKPRQVLDAMREHYERAQRQRRALGAHARHRGDRRVRGRPRQGRRVHRRHAPGRGRVHEELDRGDQPGRVRVLQRDRGTRPATRGSCSRPGDEIVISEMEHHSNIVPWQLLCERTGATLRWFGITDERPPRHVQAGRADQRAHQARLARARVQHPRHGQRDLARSRQRAHEVGALIMLDGSQSVPHLPVDVADYDVDFLAFTGHKMLGPTGIGVLWGRSELLARDAAVPRRRLDDRDGDAWSKTTFAAPPARFEAGTPPIAEAVGARCRRRLPDRARHGRGRSGTRRS